MAIDLEHPRWRDVVPYFRALPLSEKRAFYAKALKFMLEPGNWNDNLRAPVADDHGNMRYMLLAFNAHSHGMMHGKATPDIMFQWQSVRYIRKGTKRRIRKRQVSRLTYEYMQLIRLLHPVTRDGRSTHRSRVTCMPLLQREFKTKFLS